MSLLKHPVLQSRIAAKCVLLVQFKRKFISKRVFGKPAWDNLQVYKPTEQERHRESR
jgi:hypothetical protein